MLIESLEGRVCLSATVSGDTLTINGSRGNLVDVIRVSGPVGNIIVKENSESPKTFTQTGIRKIVINTNGGADKVFLNVRNTNTIKPVVTVNAGAGKDLVITTGTARDILNGQGDKDRLVSRTTSRSTGTPTILNFKNNPNINIFTAVLANVTPRATGSTDTLNGGGQGDQTF